MMKAIYEIFEEFEKAETKTEKITVIERNLSDVLINVLKYTFDPGYKFKFNEFPKEYKKPNTLQGISYAHLGTELRRLYLFQEGNETAEQLAKNPKKQKEVLLMFLESLEHAEAKVIIGIMKKDLGVKGLDYKFVKECFPLMLP